jgi:serine phosphatase RsbU (regulator of sigma subunit)/ActR/RegA family two-component response regulator
MNPAENPEDPFPHPGAEILIVEDSPTQALRLQVTLENHGFKVAAARDGAEALVALDARVPTLVISDINMPEMDGYELCRRIKEDTRLKELPVILLTSLSDPRDILKGLECGADNFIVKPYDEEFLLSRIHYVLINQQLRAQSGGGNETEIFFAGRKYRLTTERIHSIDLLLSTYETAVHKNLELSQAKAKLEEQAGLLREKNAEMAADLNMARELQAAFLPQQFPSFPPAAAPGSSALQFSSRYFTTTELGGDFFEVLPLSDTQAGVLICDVMGHGVRAALVTAIVRGLMQELRHIAADPGRLLTEINRSLVTILKQTVTPIFTSAFYLVADALTGRVRYANAGHPSPFHLQRAGNIVTPLMAASQKRGPALGVFETATFATFQSTLTPGDAIILFTDGLYEVEGPGGVFCDLDQVLAAVQKRCPQPLPQLFDELFAQLRHFALRKEFDDDVCVVGIELTRLLQTA